MSDTTAATDNFGLPNLSVGASCTEAHDDDRSSCTEPHGATVLTVYERFIAEVEELTISADMPAAAVVGELTRAVKRAQNEWDADDGEANPAMCACGHGMHRHDPEMDPYCDVCGDNTNCDYADPKTISADRWDEGWIAAMNAMTPAPIKGPARVLWALDHMPEDNPYRDEPEGTVERLRQEFAEFVRGEQGTSSGGTA